MKRSYFIAASLLLLGAVLIVLGLLSGGADPVWQKATTVCLECVGIG